MVSPLGPIVLDDDVLFPDEASNLQLLSAVQAFGDVVSRNLSQIADMDQFTRDNVALSRVGSIQGIYYAAKREAHYAMCGIGSTVNNARLVVDFNRMDLPRFRWSDRDTPVSMWMKRDAYGVSRPMYGDNAGFVWKLDQEDKSKDGAGYTAEFQIPWLDFSHLDPKLGTVRKAGEFLEITMEPKGNWTLNADIYWDGNFQETVTFNMGTDGAALGTFTLDTDRLAGQQVLNKKKRITGSGRRFSCVFRNAGAGQDFSVAKAYLHFHTMDERL
jgi:hypothetical protein